TSAAASYARVTDVTDEIITTALSVGPLSSIDPAGAATARARLHEFAIRNDAVGLLRLADAG
ncbi:hypothetical protein ACFQZ8_22480, partial [Micromonospora azadirachtae]